MSRSALLLTGGARRRTGRAKATLPSPAAAGSPGPPGPPGRSLAPCTVRALGGVDDPVLELGPGYSGVPAVADPAPVAVAARGRRLEERRAAQVWAGPAGRLDVLEDPEVARASARSQPEPGGAGAAGPSGPSGRTRP